MDLSVMFFGAGAPAAEAGDAAGYEDVLAIAREADRLGFRALWTPERHFQGVGQAFPNPALLGAALTVATERIEIRAGSAVLPLHHPVRVVEDWAVLDNLGRGRIGLSVATGWHSADFVLAPERFADRRRHAIEAVETIRRLWAGEPVELPDGLGRRVAVLPRPRPYSPALPLWLTSSGSAETWLTAARLRANVLSATSGRDREELATLIEDYRAAYAAAPPLPNTPERGTVTVMAHAYIGEDEEEALRRVDEPLRAYFRHHVAQSASNGAADGRAAALSPREIDSVARLGLRRTLAWGSLIGSASRCRRTLIDLRDLGCDEVACFVDFGLDRAAIIKSLIRLAELREVVA